MVYCIRLTSWTCCRFCPDGPTKSANSVRYTHTLAGSVGSMKNRKPYHNQKHSEFDNILSVVQTPGWVCSEIMGNTFLFFVASQRNGWILGPITLLVLFACHSFTDSGPCFLAAVVVQRVWLRGRLRKCCSKPRPSLLLQLDKRRHWWYIFLPWRDIHFGRYGHV